MIVRFTLLFAAKPGSIGGITTLVVFKLIAQLKSLC